MRKLFAGLLFGVLALGADPDWWRNAIIYEIYPRSFADTNGDGVGDLNGITEHLDYLKDLGVDAIWIAPFYPSPQVDSGYDVSDYRSIDPQYGTMDDFDRLMAEATKRGIKVINDMVLNHTSDQHPWFQESRLSRDNKWADWYVWRDPDSKGNPPNNWQSILGHSAWQWEERRKQYYYHAFHKEEPDLNWRNPAVKDALYDIMRFWLDKGVAGFRLDAVTSLFEDSQFRDEPYLEGSNAYGERRVSQEYTDNLPEVHDVLHELRRVTNEYPGRVLIGDSYSPSLDELLKMYGKNRDELHLPIDTQVGSINRLSVPLFRKRLFEAEAGLNGNVALLAFDSHNLPRSVNRYGDGLHNEEIEKLIATILLTTKGSALIYYGAEVGMTAEQPMQWSAVAGERRDPNSLLNYYRRLAKLKNENEQLRLGDFVITNEKSSAVLSYLRVTRDGQTVVVGLNFSGEAQMIGMDYAKRGLTQGKHMKTLAASFPVPEEVVVGGVLLPPYGSYVGQVTP